MAGSHNFLYAQLRDCGGFEFFEFAAVGGGAAGLVRFAAAFATGEGG
jgi:hypothetical protein